MPDDRGNAARHGQRSGRPRVLIVDWDVHHGNGTQDIFYEDGSVFFYSSHQWPLYPGTGARTETEQKIPELVRFVREAGRIPVQRDTLYNELERW